MRVMGPMRVMHAGAAMPTNSRLRSLGPSLVSRSSVPSSKLSAVPSVHMSKTWIKMYPPPQPTATAVTARSTVQSAVTSKLHGWRLRTTAITINPTMLEPVNACVPPSQATRSATDRLPCS